MKIECSLDIFLMSSILVTITTFSHMYMMYLDHDHPPLSSLVPLLPSTGPLP
jgi:hypothetical protein